MSELLSKTPKLSKDDLETVVKATLGRVLATTTAKDWLGSPTTFVPLCVPTPVLNLCTVFCGSDKDEDVAPLLTSIITDLILTGLPTILQDMVDKDIFKQGHKIAQQYTAERETS